MPRPTPFHVRTTGCCRSLRYKDWAGHYAVCAYDTYPEREYFALRHAAGLIDVSPLYKYDIFGADAARFLAFVMVRDVTRLKIGQVAYTCWCDDAGYLLDDGTVWCLDDAYFRVTSAEPAFAWLLRCADGFDVTVLDRSADFGALSLQGPCSRDVLQAACDADIDGLRYFRLVHGHIAEQAVTVTRTGFTGDLGYEVWVASVGAEPVWDALIAAGRTHGVLPAGLDAMDITRIEAGFILNGVDYFPASQCLIDARKSTPYDAGLGWTVHLDRAPFVGQAALQREHARGATWALVGLTLDWDAYERLFAEHGLPPHVCSQAWRAAVPVYQRGGRQIGQATSGAWSPVLKQNLALATVERAFAESGTLLDMEVTVEYHRRRCPATVQPRPFFDPPRKKA